MKNLLVYYDPDFTTTLEDIPVPSYGKDEILIQVHVAGSNPKDWKHPMPNYFNVKLNQGDDCAGIVAEVGADVKSFKPGDRVAGFHQMDTPRGTYAEYTVCPEHTVFHIPESLSFEEAATIPLTAFTAAVGLYRNLNLPLPFGRPDPSNPVPLVINGASGAVGSSALQLASQNPTITPIIAIAGANSTSAKELGAHIVLDYRSPTIAEDLSAALDGKKIAHVLDCVNSLSSVKYLLPILDSVHGRYNCTAGITPEQKALLQQWGGWFEQIWVGSVHDDKPAGGKMFGSVMSKVFETLIVQKQLNGRPYEVVEGGLHGVKDALIKLRDRKGGNAKFVTRIADTK